MRFAVMLLALALMACAKPVTKEETAGLDYGPKPTELGARVVALLEERKAARARRDFAAADAIRKRLDEEGIVIEDLPTGTRWKKVR